MRPSSLLARLCLLLLLAVITWIDVLSSPRLSFAIPYFACIFAAARFSPGPFAYLIAVLAAAGRFYGNYLGYPPDERALVAAWQFVSHVTVHCVACYLFSVYLRVRSFLRPNNDLLRREHNEFKGLREFIFRPYIHSEWSMAQRLQAIERHYALVSELMPLLKLRNGEVLTLAEIPILENSLKIIVDRPRWMRREGELAVSLYYDIDRIYTAMILVTGTPDSPKLIIGNLQGDGRDRAELYKRLTKELHGMRPRDFMIRVVQIIAGELGCAEILGISDKAHRSAHWLTRAAKLSAYDEVWLENGGVLEELSGFYSLPVGVPKRAEEEVPARKRNLYRRRYEFLDQLRLRVLERVDASRAA